LRVLVPLCVTDKQLQHGLDIFEDAFTSVAEAAIATTSSVG
jgi:4-aminobutyrate aminotransferase-like enzyme